MMTNYDFRSLNDKDFEVLAADLLSRHFGLHVERFKSGKDKGVDGRFFCSGEEVIVQSKHWVKSGLPRLLRYLEKEEAPKVKKLNPKNYVFVTSLELSYSDKSKIRNIFEPYIHCDSDVIGNEDLNDFLSQYPEVERNHYKLWLKSSGALSNIYNAALHGRSRHKLKEIAEESSLYVVTSNHKKAIGKLEELHSVIITGAPGVGKTFLSDQLCQHYAAQGYEFLFIENSMNEAESAYKEEAKQIFYFDDFLGRNFLLALDSHQDSQVINFIRRVAHDPKKRFVLTSRSNILNQGKRLSELFEIKKVQKNEYELSVSELTPLDKAEILYNHIWFGDLQEEYVDEIYKNRRYRDIVYHKNFNPRIISFITDSQRLSEVPPKLYWEYIARTLSNPRDIWRNVLEIQLDDVCRHIVVGLSLNGAEISDVDMRNFFSRLRAGSFVFSVSRSCDEYLKILSGALINRNVSQASAISYDLFNPSIADFVIANYLDDFDYVKEIFLCLRTQQSINNLNGLFASNTVSEEDYRKLMEFLVLRLPVSVGGSSEYDIRLLAMAAKVMPENTVVASHMGDIANRTIGDDAAILCKDFFDFIAWAVREDVLDLSNAELAERLNYWLDESAYDQDVLISMSSIAVIVDGPSGKVSGKLRDLYIDFLSDNITDMATESGVLDDIYSYDDYNPEELLEFIESELSAMALVFDDSDAKSISYCCDTDQIISSNVESAFVDEAETEYNLENRRVGEAVDDPIDDLFDRNY